VLFVCSVADVCDTGSWTTSPTELMSWTQIDLSGTATTTSYACGFSIPCEFRVGYIDGSTPGAIGGVSNEVTATGLDKPVLTATANGASGTIVLGITQPTTSATIVGYKIERFISPGSMFSLLDTPTGAITTYIDPTCGSGNTCYYRVTALYNIGTSAVSDEAFATAAL
jgi:hypothetical protein